MLVFFFDVPVYRLGEDNYYSELNDYIQNRMYPSGYARENEEFFIRNPDQKTQHENHIRETYGGAWNYNEIVGFIRLHFVGSQIRGEYWGVNAKRICRTRRKNLNLKLTH